MRRTHLLALSVLFSGLAGLAEAADLKIHPDANVCSFRTTVSFDYHAWYFRRSGHPMHTEYNCDGSQTAVDRDGVWPADIEEGHRVLQSAVSRILAKFRKHGLTISSLSESAKASHVAFDHMKKENNTMVFSGVVERPL